MTEEHKNVPKQKIKAGGLTATIWENEKKTEDGKTFTVYSISVERTYKDKEGEWTKTSSMRVEDLPKVALVCQKAYESLVMKEQE